jgi:hypothetical protein
LYTYAYAYNRVTTSGGGGLANEWLSELAAQGGTDSNPSGMVDLLSVPIISSDASAVCNGSGSAEGKLFYFIPNNYTRDVYELFTNGTDASVMHTQDVQRELVSIGLYNDIALFSSLSVFNESEILYIK